MWKLTKVLLKTLITSIVNEGFEKRVEYRTETFMDLYLWERK